MNGSFAPQYPTCDLDCSVGDHLIRVHIGLCPAASLPDALGKMLIELAVDDFLSSCYNEFGLIIGQRSKLAIHFSCGFFEEAEGTDHRAGHDLMADAKMLEGAGSLGSVVG